MNKIYEKLLRCKEDVRRKINFTPKIGRVFDTCQKYKTLQTAEMRAFLCQILFIFMLYGVVLYAIIRYEALVR